MEARLSSCMTCKFYRQTMRETLWGQKIIYPRCIADQAITPDTMNNGCPVWEHLYLLVVNKPDFRIRSA